MAGIRAEEVNRRREVRTYGLTPGIGGADAIVRPRVGCDSARWIPS
jgi:hypothetical protein